MCDGTELEVTVKFKGMFLGGGGGGGGGIMCTCVISSKDAGDPIHIHLHCLVVC